MNIQLTILIAIILYCFYTDVRYSRIPNKATIPAILLGFIINSVSLGLWGLMFALKGFAFGFVVFLIVHLLGGIGAGDVKLFGAIGSLMGFEFVLYTTVYSVLLAGVIGVIVLIYKRDIIRRLLNIPILIWNAILQKNVQPFHQYKKFEAYQFPFMYAALPGVLVTIYSFYFL